MADVQLEHGHVRIANALAEAIVCAPFTATQMKLVLCIVRLSWGWRARTVRISLTELAAKTRVAFTGGFRRQFDDLLHEGVITVVEEPFGRTAAAYSINKDYENWGRFAVATKLLESLFTDRPATARRVPLQGQSNNTPTLPPQGHPSNEEGAPTGAVTMPPQGHPPCPPGGIVDGSKSALEGRLDPPKDIEIQERQLTTTPRAREEAVQKFAVGLTTAANNAIAEKWGEETRTRPLRWDQATQLAFELMQRDVDLELARRAIVDCVRASKNPRPPRTLNYFSDAIDDAVKIAQQRTYDAENPAPAATKRRGPPQRLANVVNAKANAERAELEQLYNQERAVAAAAWGKDPENAMRYRAILSAANTKFAQTLETSWGEKGRNAEVVIECAKAAGFPSIDEWERARSLTNGREGAGEPMVNAASGGNS